MPGQSNVPQPFPGDLDVAAVLRNISSHSLPKSLVDMAPIRNTLSLNSNLHEDNLIAADIQLSSDSGNRSNITQRNRPELGDFRGATATTQDQSFDPTTRDELECDPQPIADDGKLDGGIPHDPFLDEEILSFGDNVNGNNSSNGKVSTWKLISRETQGAPLSW